MSKTIKTVLAIVGALTTLCAVLLLLKKKLGCKCKKCCEDKAEDLPETVEDFVDEAADKVEDAVEEAKEAAEEVVEEAKDAAEEAKEKAEAIAEEFKDYADVEQPAEPAAEA